MRLISREFGFPWEFHLFTQRGFVVVVVVVMLTYLSQNGFGRFILFIVEKLRARKPPVDSDAMRPKLTSAKK